MFANVPCLISAICDRAIATSQIGGLVSFYLWMLVYCDAMLSTNTEAMCILAFRGETKAFLIFL